MAGRPVTIRLLDPPLHEFVPHDEEGQERLGRANLVLRKRKIDFALVALRIAPGLLHRLILWRNPTEYKFLH